MGVGGHGSSVTGQQLVKLILILCLINCVETLGNLILPEWTIVLKL